MLAVQATGFWLYVAMLLNQNEFPLLKRLDIDASASSLNHLFDIARIAQSPALPSLDKLVIQIGKLDHNGEVVPPTPYECMAKEWVASVA